MRCAGARSVRLVTACIDAARRQGRQKYDTSLVLWRRGRGGAFLRRHVCGQQRRRHPARTRRLSGRQTGRCVDGAIYRAGHAVRGPQRRPRVPAQRRVSFQVATDDQREPTAYGTIVHNGGQESACGWCKDKWGLLWQITPRALTAAIADPDREAAGRAFDAIIKMGKIDMAAIEAARRG